MHFEKERERERERGPWAGSVSQTISVRFFQVYFNAVSPLALRPTLGKKENSFFKQSLWKTILKPDPVETCLSVAWTDHPISLSLFSTDMERRVIFYPIWGPSYISSCFNTSWLLHCWPMKSHVQQNNNKPFIDGLKTMFGIGDIVKNLQQVKTRTGDLQMQFPSILDCWN